MLKNQIIEDDIIKQEERKFRDYKDIPKDLIKEIIKYRINCFRYRCTNQEAYKKIANEQKAKWGEGDLYIKYPELNETVLKEVMKNGFHDISHAKNKEHTTKALANVKKYGAFASTNNYNAKNPTALYNEIEKEVDQEQKHFISQYIEERGISIMDFYKMCNDPTILPIVLEDMKENYPSIHRRDTKIFAHRMLRDEEEKRNSKEAINTFIDLISMNEQLLRIKINSMRQEKDKSNKTREVSLGCEEGKVYMNWVNSNAIYYPSGYRALGFKVDDEFYIKYIKYIKTLLGKARIENVKKNFENNPEMFLQFIKESVVLFFGVDSPDNRKRNKIYSHKNKEWNNFGEYLNISDLAGESVSECIEKSACLNQFLNLIGYDSSLVLSDTTYNGETQAHAYCITNGNPRYKIIDPSYVGKGINGNTINFIFQINLDENGNEITYDTYEYGESPSKKVTYQFPKDEYRIALRNKNSQTDGEGDKPGLNAIDMMVAAAKMSLKGGNPDDIRGYLNSKK